MLARQEAILAAISEKDAHVAVLEMAPNKKTENIEEVEKLTKEKLRLQQVLKDLVRGHNFHSHCRTDYCCQFWWGCPLYGLGHFPPIPSIIYRRPSFTG